MTRPTALAIVTAAIAILGAVYIPAGTAELELAAEQLAEARRLQIEQAEEDRRAELVKQHKGAEQ